MLKLDRIWKIYRVGAFGTRQLTAVKDVSFDVRPGEVVSLIGESGSGKTTLGRMVLRLNSVTRGRIDFHGVDVSTLSGRPLKEYYRKVQGVFQDPFSSYNPIFKADRVFGMVKDQFFGEVPNRVWREKIDGALADVRLDPGQVLNKYPHQLSGGQLQRMLIARALLLDIEILVADEIISMLDASTRIDVLNLLADLKARGLGVLFVTHDLALGNYISTRTVILRKGIAVEQGVTGKVFADPQHPYSKRLLGSVPQLHKKWSQVAAELRLGDPQAHARCLYHETYPGECGSAPVDPAQPALVKYDEDHYVACVREAADPVEADLVAA
jgi:peptide/nickel transport system ATP-binding protein